jgi:hypothetical protein
MERSVEVVAIILFGVIGLSHLMQPAAWVEFFTILRSKGKPGSFVDGLLNLALAAVIIGFHNVWSGVPAVLTVVGWCLLVKCLLRLCFPQLSLRMMARVSVDRTREFQLAGAGFLALAALLTYGLYVARTAT